MRDRRVPIGSAPEFCPAAVTARQNCSSRCRLPGGACNVGSDDVGGVPVQAAAKIRAWHLNRRSATDLSGLAEDINAQVRGWIGYYGAFYRSRLYPIATRID